MSRKQGEEPPLEHFLDYEVRSWPLVPERLKLNILS